MKIENVGQPGKKIWNDFIRAHYPPVGGFMQSWEWGVFQKRLGRRVEHYFVTEHGAPIAAFTLLHHKLPFGLKYGYAARGPVAVNESADKFMDICEAIRIWALGSLPQFVFLRLEPPIQFPPPEIPNLKFRLPHYYVQPRYNLAVPLGGTEEEILHSFHPSTRSNIGRAVKRGVTVKIRTDITHREYEHFTDMIRDTINRNRGTNAYPKKIYFDALFSALSQAGTASRDPHGLSLAAFYGYHEGVPAATHFVLFFGTTATYLYGASYTKHLNSKVTTYLHWAAMQEAKRKDMSYYDLGAIDKKRWPTLTEFKRQFRGREFSYLGNIDIPLRPLLYEIYTFARGIKR